jgi:hypothetical protein
VREMSEEQQDLDLKKYLHMIEHFITDHSTIILYVLLSPLLQYSLPIFSWFSSIFPCQF